MSAKLQQLAARRWLYDLSRFKSRKLLYKVWPTIRGLLYRSGWFEVTKTYTACIVYEDGWILDVLTDKLSFEPNLCKKRRNQSYHLRFDVFCKHGTAKTSNQNTRLEIEKDAYDPADYAMVVCTYRAQIRLGAASLLLGRPFTTKVVGLYRLIEEELAAKGRGFYTAEEYTTNFNKKVEISRLAIALEEQGGSMSNNSVPNLLFSAILSYMAKKRLRYFFGTGSFPTANAADHIEGMSFLYATSPQPPEIAMQPNSAKAPAIKLLPLDELGDTHKIFRKLPMPMRFYLGLGGSFSLPVVDKVFDTTDMGVLVDAAAVKPKTLQRYARTPSVKAYVEDLLALNTKGGS